jgi:predicted butyrate kinase (DUF1464 family)
MPRVIGIDPGTLSVDICGLEDGRLFLDRSFATTDALAQPSPLVTLLEDEHRRAPLNLVAGPSGYGLPLTRACDLTEKDVRLACLAPSGESGGIGGLGTLMRTLARVQAPVVFTPGVVHLASVPAHRKVNRVDMGTADKVCAAALAIREHSERRGCGVDEASFILLELGGAFTAAIAVERGRIVDGVGGTSGPIGSRAAGALDGEVAYLAGSVTKRMLFTGGADTIAGAVGWAVDRAAATPQGRQAMAAYVESAVKAVAMLRVSAPSAYDVILSGRLAAEAGVHDTFVSRLSKAASTLSVHPLRGLATVAKQSAQGAALVADGLAGGTASDIVEAMGLRHASGTVLDYLHVITKADALARLGIAKSG